MTDDRRIPIAAQAFCKARHDEGRSELAAVASAVRALDAYDREQRRVPDWLEPVPNGQNSNLLKVAEALASGGMSLVFPPDEETRFYRMARKP